MDLDKEILVMTDLLLYQIETNKVEPYPFGLKSGDRLLSGISRAIAGDTLATAVKLFGPLPLLTLDEKSKLRRICARVSTAFDVMTLDFCNYRETDPVNSIIVHIEQFSRHYRELKYFYLPNVYITSLIVHILHRVDESDIGMLYHRLIYQDRSRTRFRGVSGCRIAWNIQLSAPSRCMSHLQPTSRWRDRV